MSDNPDSFIDEVTEEVRKDRLFKLFVRYGWIAGLVIVAIVGGAAVNEYLKAQARTEAQAFGDAVLTALEAESPEARSEALAAIEGAGTPEAQAVQAMLAAEGGSADALWAVAENGDLPEIWRDMAVLKAALASSGEMEPSELIARLEPLAVPGAPYRLLALEQIALAELNRGAPEATLDILGDILADADTGQGLRQRAEQLIVALGGDPGAV
ncbi:MAG: hypothetical protein AAF871_09830 [Pseudomonadota bacterium]